MSKKRDINLLKASGSGSYVRMKASFGFIAMLLVIVIAAILGYVMISSVIKNQDLQSQIAQIQNFIDNPQNEIQLAEYQEKKGVYESLLAENEHADALKAAIEQIYRIPTAVFDDLYDSLPQELIITEMRITSSRVITLRCEPVRELADDAAMQTLYRSYRDALKGSKLLITKGTVPGGVIDIDNDRECTKTFLTIRLGTVQAEVNNENNG